MDKSFVLLSSMSPKINKHKKNAKKNTASVLATKKHFRRSYVLENADRTIGNQHLNIVEGSTDSSSVSVNKLVTKKTKDSAKCNVPGELLAKEKVSQIERWLENLEVDNTDYTQNHTNFTEVSTILGDDVTYFKTEGLGIATNSTFANCQSKPFNGYFKKKCDKSINNHEVINEKNSSSSSDCILTENLEINKPIVIDDSLNMSLKDITNLVFKNKKDGALAKIEESVIVIEDSVIVDSSIKHLDEQNNSVNNIFGKQQDTTNIEKNKYKFVSSRNNDRLTSEKEISQNFSDGLSTKHNEVELNISDSSLDMVNETDMEELLDTIYGDKWRPNKDIVLPRSEPRKHVSQQPKVVLPNTERKPRLEILRNRSEGTGKVSLLKSVLESEEHKSIMKSSKHFLYDSDTDDDQYHKVEAVSSRFRTKLTFDIDNDENGPSACPNQEINESQENLSSNDSFDYLPHVSLDQRIRNKQNELNEFSKRIPMDFDQMLQPKNNFEGLTSNKENLDMKPIKSKTSTEDVSKISKTSIKDTLSNKNHLDCISKKTKTIVKDTLLNKKRDKSNLDSNSKKSKGNIEDATSNKNHIDTKPKKTKTIIEGTLLNKNRDDKNNLESKTRTPKNNADDTTANKNHLETKSKKLKTKKMKNTDDFIEPIAKPPAPIFRSNTVCNIDDDNEVDDEWDREITRIMEIRRKTQQFPKTTYGFLESLSGNVPLDRCDPSARIFRKCYKQQKSELAQELFRIFNGKVFDNCIPTDTPLEWNDRLRGTAGRCHCKKMTHRSGAIERNVKIVLSTKVLDSADRLRDTLLHELCHAATWIANSVCDGHGSYWKSWAYKAMRTFPELPPIKRCHDYVINTKYVYKCVQCSYSIGRHTKSLDIERKRCGYCYGKFEVLINKTSKTGETKTVPVTPRKEPSPFAMFVKENYADHKSPSLKHADVMKILGQKFSDLKLKQS